MGIQWENPKMCNILKRADGRAKRMEIWDSRSYAFRPGMSFGALSKIPMLRFSKVYFSAIFIQFQTNFIKSMVIGRKCSLLLFGRSAKL